MPVTHLKHIIILSLLQHICCMVLSQPYCNVRTFGSGDGLVTNKVNGIVQDGHGLMWFSSWNGIMCYDGYSFTSFRGNEDNMKILSSKRMHLMKKSSMGGLWCVSHYGDLYYYDSESCRFVDVSSFIQRKIRKRLNIVNIFPLETGYTWLDCKETKTNRPYTIRLHDKSAIVGHGIEQLPQTGAALKGAFAGSDGSEWLQYNHALTLHGKGVMVRGTTSCVTNIGRMVCCATGTGQIFCYDTKTRNRRYITLHAGVSQTNSIVSMGKNTIACGTNIGVVVYNMQTGYSRVFATEGGTSVGRIYVDSKHRLWAYSQQSGVSLIDMRGNTVTQLNAQAATPEEKTGCNGHLWIEDANHTIWCVPRNGTFSYYDEQSRRLIPYVLRSVDFKECIPLIMRTCVDNQGNVWCTAPHSLHRISFSRQQFHKVLLENHQETRSLMYDRSGCLWAGNVNGTLAVYDRQYARKGYWGNNGVFDTRKNTFAERSYFIFQDSKGRVWVATKGNGLYLFEKGKMKNYRHNKQNPYSLSCDTLFCVDQDTRGRIWVGAYGTTGGLNLVDEYDGTLRFINRNNVLRQPQEGHFQTIRRITHTANGVMILSTCDGIVTFSDRFSKVSGIRFHYSGSSETAASQPLQDVMQTIVMRSGRIFAATQTGELLEIDPKSLLGRLKVNVRNQQSTVQGLIMAMQEDDRGQLWIVRENNLERFDPKSGDIYFYDVSMPGGVTEFTEALPAYNRTTGEMALGTIDGFVMFQPRQLSSGGLKPSIVFSTLYYHDDTTPHPILYSRQVVLPSNRRSVTVNFSALDYAGSGDIRYAYKLEGVDHDWQYIGCDHKATFSHLPSGHFKLLVKSTDREGHWLDNTAVLNIYAEPTFWESWMGWSLYIIVVAVLLLLVWHYLNIRRKAKNEKEMHEQKIKLYTDASHRLRTPLTLIGGPVAEMLMDKDLPEKWHEGLEMVRRNVRSMLEMIDNMLVNNTDNTFFVDDDHIPVFGEVDESLVGMVEKRPWDENLRLLVVEDNDDLRTFLKGILSNTYNVITARNGQEGLDKAIAEMPDFIITDVTMPVMDGLTMVHEIKQRPDICHIPIIVLSAKASLDDKLKGMEEGVDDYITKPFSSVYLKNRVENIITQRHLLQQSIVESLQNRQNTVRPAEDGTSLSHPSHTDYRLSSPEIVDYDKKMMESLMAYLEEHIADANLRVNDMAKAVGINRSALFIKMKSIVGMTPVDFVRQLRMQRAMELVAKSTESFSQIAYAVGFTDPRYFSRVFKKETGMTPSEYRAESQSPKSSTDK